MKRKFKVFIMPAALFMILFSGYTLWLTLRPVDIIAVHQSEHYSSVLVKNFPFTDRQKIKWWRKNRETLETVYNIPDPAPNDSFNITFWLFDGKYKKYKYDLLCFDDLKREDSCIDKKPVFTVRRFNHEDIVLITYEGRYKLQNNGEIVEIPQE